MTLARLEDHAGDARSRLAEEFKGKVGIAAILDAFSAQWQAVEDALWQLRVGRWITTAVGAQLDVLGRILKEPRGPVPNDDVYRLFLLARVRVLRSSGTVPDILSVFAAATGNVARVVLLNQPMAGFTVQIFDYVVTWQRDPFVAFLGDARAAGVKGILEWIETLESDALWTARSCNIDDAPAFDGLVTVPSTDGFPDSGDLILDEGTALEETIHYSGKSADTFFSTTLLVNSHGPKGTASLIESDKKGLGDATNSTVGGQIAGALAS